MLAVPCKTAVARKALRFAWERSSGVESAAIYRFGAARHFGVSVDACALIVRFVPDGRSKECRDYESLAGDGFPPARVFGLRDGRLAADVPLYEKRRVFSTADAGGWRSGIKHDCSSVFELHKEGDRYVNGLGEAADLEDDLVFPLLKSSDLACCKKPHRYLLVPQRTIAENLKCLESYAPKVWTYLMTHSSLIDKRASSVYRGRPRFSIFGVGAYCFAPWKVGISGFYKKLEFVKVPPFENRPVMLDDTCYFFACQSEGECDALHDIVSSTPAREYWPSLISWDSKRPITAALLNSLDLYAVARAIGRDCEAVRALAGRNCAPRRMGAQGPSLFPKEAAV